MTKSDPLVVEAAINEMCSQPEMRYTLEVRHESPTGRAHGKGVRILLEGHDISHLVTDMTWQSSTTDAVRVTFEMVGLRPV